MAIVTPDSIVYTVVSGTHKGQVCVIRGKGCGKRSVGVVFTEHDGNRVVTVEKEKLAQLEVPGWPDRVLENTYGLEEYRDRHSGDGTCMLRTKSLAQPRALIVGDMLATGEPVVEGPRRGFNSSVLVRLEKTGWVELAGRLPIALSGNKEFRLPCQILRRDRLATGCLIVKTPVCMQVGWTTIALERVDCVIDVPSCIPLALAY